MPQIVNCLTTADNTALAAELTQWAADKTAQGFTVQAPCLSTTGMTAKQFYDQFWARGGPRPDYVNFIGPVPRLVTLSDSDGHGARPEVADGYFLTPGLTALDFDASYGRSDAIYFTKACAPIGGWGEIYFDGLTNYSLTRLQLYQRYFNKLHAHHTGGGSAYTARIARNDYLGSFEGIGTGLATEIAAYSAFIDDGPRGSVTATPSGGGEDGFWLWLASNPRVWEISLSGGLPFSVNGLYYIGAAPEWAAHLPRALYSAVMGSYLSDMFGLNPLIPTMLADADTLVVFYTGHAQAKISSFLAGGTAGAVVYTPSDNGIGGGVNPISMLFGDASHRMSAAHIAAFNPSMGNAASGAAAGVSTVQGALRGVGLLAGTVSGAAVACLFAPGVYVGQQGSLETPYQAISGTAAGVAGQTAAASSAGAIRGISAGIAGAQATPHGTGRLAGVSSGVAQAIAFYSIPSINALRGTVAGSAAAQATPHAIGRLQGVSAGVSSQTGTLHVPISGPTGTSAGSCTVIALLGGAGGLAGTSYGTSTCTLGDDPCPDFVAQPGWLDAAQLEGIQEVVLLSLPFRADVVKDIGTAVDEQGNRLADWETLACYNCDVEPIQVLSESVGGSKLVSTGLFLVTLPFDATLLPEYRLRINGVTYEVENDLENLTDQACVCVTVRESR